MEEEKGFIDWEERFGILKMYEDRLEKLFAESKGLGYEPFSSPAPETQPTSAPEAVSVIDSLVEHKYQKESVRVLEGYDDIIKNTLREDIRMQAARAKKSFALFLREEGKHWPLEKRLETLDYHEKVLDLINSR